MKKIMILMSTVILCIGIVGCGKGEDSSTQTKNDLEASQSEQTSIDIKEEAKVDELTYDITYQRGETYKDSSGMVWANAIWEVTNTGSDTLYLSPTSIELENKNGDLIDTMKLVSVCPEIISPGEKAYYYQASILDEVIHEVDIVPLAIVNAKKAKLDKILLEPPEVEIYDDPQMGVKARGKVKNSTDKAQNMLTIAVVLFNENDKPAHVLSTMLVDELLPGDEVEFEASSLSVSKSFTSNYVRRYEVFVYPQQFQF